MMKLILSLTLIWTLSSTAEAVECWIGEGDDTGRNFLFPCDSTQLCATVALKANINGTLTQDALKLCLPSSLFSVGKHTFSLNVGFATMVASVHVCNTDRCNSQVIPHPGDQKKNNLQCFTCDDRSSAACNKKVQCAGTEDRCVRGTAEDNEGPIRTSGCASAKLCELASHLELLPVPIPVRFPTAPKCCGSNLCNSG